MKKISQYIKLLVLLCFLTFANPGQAQSTCTAIINSTVGLSGAVTFSGSAYNQSSFNIAGNVSWTFGDGATASGYMMNTTSHNYANGVYTVMMTITNTTGCNSTATQTLSITNSGCSLDASFIFSQGASGAASFTNTTTNGTISGVSYSWNFGDGGTSTSQNIASHVYAANGPYVVTLVANNNSTPMCIDTQTLSVFVQSVCDLVPALTYSTGANGYMTLQNISTSPGGYSLYSHNYYVDFGDGSGGSSISPGTWNGVGHSYLAGVYTAVLTATNQATPTCTSTASTTFTIGSPGCGLLAGFTSAPGSSGLINFNNTSTGTSGSVTYNWNFGDGGNSTNVSPAHTYVANGSYVVTLVANNNGTATCTDTKTLTISVSSVCDLTPSFIYTLGTNGQVTFGNNSISGAGWGYNYIINFGDGNASSMPYGGGNYINHTYTNGVYNVVVTATNIATPTCTYTTMQTVTVTSGICVANANFSMTPTGTPQFWNAFPMAPSNIVAATWNWGDNSSSNTLYTTHTYSAAGTYSICLSVTATCGATATACMPYAIYKPSGTDKNMEVIQVEVIDPATVGIKNVASENLVYIISPNPNSGSFHLNMSGLPDKNVKIAIYNLVGKEVYKEESPIQNGKLVKEINLDEVSSGVYFIKLNADNKVLTKKLIVNKQ